MSWFVATAALFLPLSLSIASDNSRQFLSDSLPFTIDITTRDVSGEIKFKIERRDEHKRLFTGLPTIFKPAKKFHELIIQKCLLHFPTEHLAAAYFHEGKINSNDKVISPGVSRWFRSHIFHRCRDAINNHLSLELMLICLP